MEELSSKIQELKQKHPIWAPVIDEADTFIQGKDLWDLIKIKGAITENTPPDELYQLRVSYMTAEESTGQAMDELIEKTRLLKQAGSNVSEKYARYFSLVSLAAIDILL